MGLLEYKEEFVLVVAFDDFESADEEGTEEERAEVGVLDETVSVPEAAIEVVDAVVDEGAEVVEES